jgi:autotransporter-associated beta strand protein
MAARLAGTVLAAASLVQIAATRAWASCTPAAANNVTATCTGITTNQAGGAPGTNAGFYGYGTGTETGVTVNVGINASVIGSGSDTGIFLGDATVTNNTGGIINGDSFGIKTATGSANVTNSGSIGAFFIAGIEAQTNATVTNNAGANIASGVFGIYAVSGYANVTNSGNISGDTYGGIVAQTNATVTNHAGAIISGAQYGIYAISGFANVINSGSISGTLSAGIYAQTNATVTNNAGAIIKGGPYGILANAGGSSIFNAGSIIGGTAAISFSGNGNTLTLGPGSVISGNVLGTGSDTFQLGGTGAATFDVSQLGSQYQGFGTFNKIGSSVWTLTGTSSYAGPININGGTLDVNGNIASASGVMVNAGGTLGGDGPVANTTIRADGIFAPGDGTPGSSMTVSGNLAFQSGALYLVQLNSTTSTFANVTGVATLAGTVGASLAAGNMVMKRYTILTAAGGFNGAFDGVGVVGVPGSLIATLSYDPTHAYLNFALNFGATPGMSVNQQNVGNGLANFFNTSGGIPLAFASLSPAGLTQVSGQSATGSQQATFAAMNLFLGVLTDPFVTGRSAGETGGTSATPFAEEGNGADVDAAKKLRDAFAKLPTEADAARKNQFDPHWSVWGAAYGGGSSTDGNAALGSSAVTARAFGFVTGADYRISPFTLAGFALAGGGTNFNVNGFGTGRSDLFQAGAFVRQNVGPAYVSAALAYGWQDITTDRTVTVAGLDHLRAEFNASAFSGRAEGGYRFVTPWMGVTPYAAGQFTTFDLPAYAESVVSGAGTFAMSYAAKNVTASRSELGTRTDASFAMQDAILTLRGRFAWAYDFNTDRNIVATFQTLPGASFVVNGAAQAHDSALTSASAEMKWLNGFSLAATFEGEFSSVTRSYAGKGVVRYVW